MQIQDVISRYSKHIDDARTKHALAVVVGNVWPSSIEPLNLFFPDQTAEQRSRGISPVCAQIDAPVWPLIEAFPPQRVAIGRDNDVTLNLSGTGTEIYPVWITTCKEDLDVDGNAYQLHWYSANVKMSVWVKHGVYGTLPACQTISYQFGHAKHYLPEALPTDPSVKNFENFLKGETC